MYVRTLQLTNYRNFRRLSLTLEDGPTVVQAQNAQGKTNLLEAIELLATARSARAGSERELIHWAAQEPAGDAAALAEPFGRVSAVVGRGRDEVRAEVLLRLLSPGEREQPSLSPAARPHPNPLPEGEGARPLPSRGEGIHPVVSKAFRLNGLPRRALEFIGEVNVVSFSPQDVELVAGPPSERRRYLDLTNSQASRRYLRALQRYQKVLLQRNHLLRDLRERGGQDPTLALWNAELATDGSLLLQERARSTQALSQLADHWFHTFGGQGGRLEIRYRPGIDDAAAEALCCVSADTDDTLDGIQGAFLGALERAAPRERAAGLSLVGPHRDDLSFLVDGIDLKVYGSRGEQRLAALSTKLAEMDLLAARAQSRPILLLDDVLSELDDRKQAAVLRMVATGGQTILTLTALGGGNRAALGDAPVLRLEAGALVETPVATDPPSAPVGTRSAPTPTPPPSLGEGPEERAEPEQAQLPSPAGLR